MTTEYLIHPIPLIAIEMDMPKMTHLQNYGQKVDGVIYVWYLEGGSKKVCVDAGGSVRSSSIEVSLAVKQSRLWRKVWVDGE